MAGKSNRSVLLVIVILFAGVGLGYFFYKKHTIVRPAAVGFPGMGIPSVKAYPVELQFRGEKSLFMAKVSGYRVADVRPQVSGVLYKRLFEEGTFVKKGQVLYYIDPVEQIAVRAPVSGYIGRSVVTEGALVVANQTQALTQINQIDPIFIDVAVPSKYAVKLTKEKDVDVSVLINDKKYEGRVILKAVERVANGMTDSVIVRLEASNIDEVLLPNMIVDVEFEINKSEKMLMPHRVADFLPNGEKFVWVIDGEGVVNQRVIKAEEVIDNFWLVDEGLEVGEMVVYEGLQQIKPGAKVNIEKDVELVKQNFEGNIVKGNQKGGNVSTKLDAAKNTDKGGEDVHQEDMKKEDRKMRGYEERMDQKTARKNVGDDDGVEKEKLGDGSTTEDN